MSFDAILGQEKAVAVLRGALRNGRLAHANLFIGPEGVGKLLTTLTLVKAMNCQAPPETGDCCEKCPSCIKVNTGNHADVILVEPEGEAIKIGQVRELQKRLRFRPMEGGRRACILDSADCLNEEASNALLKLLEEPPRDTHLFLITSRPHRLLPTLVSRCQWVRFQPLSTAHVARILENGGVDRENALFYASLAGGSAGQARALSNRVDFQRRLDWLRVFFTLSQRPAAEIFEICEKMAKEEEGIGDLLELWKILVRDLMVLKTGGEAAAERLINRDLKDELSREARKFSFERLDLIFQSVLEAQRSLTRNVNRQLLLETLLLGIRGTGNTGQSQTVPFRTGSAQRPGA